MSEDKTVCQTCNGTGLEAPRAVCRDCEEPFADYTDNGNSGPAARPSPTGEKVERFSSSNIMWSMDNIPLLHNPNGEWVRYSDYAALEAERDEAQLRIAYLEEEIVRVRDLAVEHSTHSATANARMERLEKALEFYANPEHWRTRNADGDLANQKYGIGYHRTDPDGIMEVLGSNCGHWAASTFEVHGGHWQADAGHVARAALTGGANGEA